MSKISRIREFISLSAGSLGEAIQHYWPVINYEKNGLQESNLTIHFAVHAMGAGLHAYPEASNGNYTDGHSRVDLLVRGLLDQDYVTILIESKKLFSAEKAQDICRDYAKIKAFEFVRRTNEETRKSESTAYGVLLAITSRESNAAWWQKPYLYDDGAWDNLGTILKGAGDRGVFEVSGLQHQYILYAIYALD